ncbi:MAG TPA: Flp family type IVb pilin [Acetobacteraceae bacterium]|nr:Flp family type IVb pilin [Acetobacteraceae bacterium]
MSKILQLAIRCLAVKFDRRGVTAIEYALIAALIAVAIIGSLSLIGGTLSNAFNTIASDVGSAN